MEKFECYAGMKVKYNGEIYDVIAANLVEGIYCIKWSDDPDEQQLWIRYENCEILNNNT